MKESLASRPDDILWIIFTHIPQNPLEYMRLSKVSKQFYYVFTSDRMWQYLDPYGWKTDIYAQFISLMNRVKPAERTNTRNYWLDRNLPPKPMDNYYCFLGYYCKRDVPCIPENSQVDNPQVLWCASHVRANVLRWTSHKSDKELSFMIVQTDPALFTLLQGGSKRDKDLVLAALENIKPKGVVDILQHCDEMFLDDLDVMLAAVKKDGLLLERASKELQSDYNLVKAAVSQNGKAILSAKLEVTRSLLIDALSTAPVLKNFPQYWQDEEAVRLVTSKYPNSLREMPSKWRDGHKNVIIAAKYSADSFILASDRLKDDEDAALEVVKMQPMALRYVSPRLRDNEKVVWAAINENASSLQYASNRLGLKRNVVKQAIRKNGGKDPRGSNDGGDALGGFIFTFLLIALVLWLLTID